MTTNKIEIVAVWTTGEVLTNDPERILAALVNGEIEGFIARDILPMYIFLDKSLAPLADAPSIIELELDDEGEPTKLVFYGEEVPILYTRQEVMDMLLASGKAKLN